MRSFQHIGEVPAAQALAADEILELHASRLLMLLRFTGTANRIEGLTKLAKLDFFVRYPDAFDRMAAYLRVNMRATTSLVESPMVRYHYGPWDRRYYQILPFLEARGLIQVQRKDGAFIFALTESGRQIAESLSKEPAFVELREQMRQVKKLLGPKTGSAIKKLIYKVFKEEVTERPLGEVIT